MSHIMMELAGGINTTWLNVDFYLFTSEKWYLDGFLQHTNGYTDVDCGTFSDPIVNIDYGVI